MAYLGYLVQQGVIKEAYCNFLPVGHTHEDIDQFFSRISVFTRHHNAQDPSVLRECIRRCFKKYGRHPIVVGWDTVANLSEYFKEFTHSHMSKDITLYYQLRIRMGKGEQAGEVIMQARTWPGAKEHDKDDFWRGLQVDTSYVRLFHKKPQLYEDRYILPTQAQPQHIGTNPDSEERGEYRKQLDATRVSIERLMESCGSVFTALHKANMRLLLDALGSNLEPWHAVEFAWDADDMDYLYNQGQYVAHAPEPAGDECEDQSLYDDSHVLDAIQRERPDGIRNPAAFADAVEDGLINLQVVENVQSCVLVVGKFYLQRPPVLDRPFNLVKVVRVSWEDDGKSQWGAWVHPWEISTSGDEVDYFKDPWHASADHKGSQRYNEKKHAHEQAATWTYPLSILSEFQVEVQMKKQWTKPRLWSKPMCAGYGVPKRSIMSTDVPRLRNYTHRWNEDEEVVEDEL